MSIKHQRAGFRGYLATYRKYGEAQMNEWRRMGGRPRRLTNAELRALKAAATEQPTGVRSITTKGGAHAALTTTGLGLGTAGAAHISPEGFWS